MKLIYIVLLALSFQFFAIAQNETGIVEKDSVSANDLNENLKSKIGIIARSYSDSVIVRWAVSKPAVWDLCKEFGFILERAPILKNNSYGDFQPVNSGIFKPWTEEQWLSYFKSKPQSNDSSEIDYDAFAYLLGSPDKDSISTEGDKSTGNELQDVKNRKSRYSWKLLLAMLSANSSITSAEGLGLRYVDKNVKLGERYVYKIKLAGNSPVYIVEDGLVEVTVENYNPDFAKQELIASENDGSIGINWKANNQLSFYKVERSDDNGKTFVKMTKAPLLTMKNNSNVNNSLDGYLDTLIVNYKKYIYKVYGTTSFADNVLIGEIKAMGRDRTPPEQPFASQPEQINEKEVKIKWQMNEIPAKDLNGFYIGRDTSASGEFKYITKLLPKNSREYIDNGFLTDAPNFYLVEAVDTAGNISQSYPVYVALNDTTPPSIPKWLSGSMDSNGVVTLMLKPNIEKDLMGYRILRSNSPEHEFSSLIESFGSDSLDYKSITEFKDTVSLETTTPYIYYRAAALDNRYNESDYSEIIAVKRPDIIPPVAPLINDVSVTDKAVTLFVIPSISEDLNYQVVYRRILDSGKWDSLYVLKFKDTVFTDNNVKQNTMYEYALLAVDSSGLRSNLSPTVAARPYYTGVLPAVNNLKVSYNEKSKKILLSWEYGNSKDIYFVIYRSFENLTPASIASVKDPASRSFIDLPSNDREGNYYYTVKVLDYLSGESKMSEKVNVYVK